jgi:hypothetical protein
MRGTRLSLKVPLYTCTLVHLCSSDLQNVSDRTELAFGCLYPIADNIVNAAARSCDCVGWYVSGILNSLNPPILNSLKSNFAVSTIR